MDLQEMQNMFLTQETIKSGLELLQQSYNLYNCLFAKNIPSH